MPDLIRCESEESKVLSLGSTFFESRGDSPQRTQNAQRILIIFTKFLQTAKRSTFLDFSGFLEPCRTELNKQSFLSSAY